MGKGLLYYCITVLLMGLVGSTHEAIGQVATSPDTPMPIPLTPILKEEQNTQTITLPPAAPAATTGISEDAIHQYFDAVPPVVKQLPDDAKKTLEVISKQWQKDELSRDGSSHISIQRGGVPASSIDSTLQQTSEQIKKLGITLSDKAKDVAPNLRSVQEMAYRALMAGQIEAAISLYKQSLKMSPGNKTSLFGLATTYHRNGQLTQARMLYSEILSKYPDDRDTINNFMALISNSAPQDALVELLHLEAANPGFSPIAAQIGMIYQRLGDDARAVQYLEKAVGLSPENLSYRYNLAIIFDRLGHWQEAATLYQQLLNAASEGVTIPGDSRTIQERLLYITKKRIEG